MILQIRLNLDIFTVWKKLKNSVVKCEKTFSYLENDKEVCTYLGIGQTKAREMIRGHNGFGVRIGNRWYPDKKKLEKWLENNTI